MFVETGGIAITPRPSAPGAEIRPAMPMRPFFGIDPVLLDPVTVSGNQLKCTVLKTLLIFPQSTELVAS